MNANPRGVLLHVYVLALAIAVGALAGPAWSIGALALGLVLLLAL